MQKNKEDNNATTTETNTEGEDITKQKPKFYSKEPLITDEIFYDQTNTLFLYRSEKNISIKFGVLPETEKVKDETNPNKIK